MTDKKINYVFSASGPQGVVSAFKSITAAANENAKAVAKSATGAVAAQTRGAKDLERLASRVERDQVRAEQRTQREREKALRDGHRAMLKASVDYDRTRRRAAEQTRRAEEKERAHEKRALERHAAQKQRILEQDRRSRQQALHGAVGSAMGTAGSLVAGTGMAMIGAVAAAGVMATRAAVQLQEQANRAAIAGRSAGASIDSVGLRKRWENAAIANKGVTAESVGGGYSTFVGKTGDVDMANKMLDTWATAASATGAEITDLAGVTADLFQKFDIKTVEGMRDAFATFTFQGKKGAFELRDAAAFFPEIAAAANRYGIQKGAGGVRLLGGLTQLARPEAGSAAEASTAVENMFTKLIMESGKLKSKWGVDVYQTDASGKQSTRDIRDVLTEAIVKVGGKDMQAKAQGLQEIFDVRGIKAITGLMRTYNDAVKQGADGAKAIRDAFSNAIDATGEWSDVQEDANYAQKDASAQLTGAWEQIKAAAAEKVLPILSALAERFGAWMETADFDGFAEALSTAVSLIGEFGSAAIDAAVQLGLISRDTTDPAKRRAKDEHFLDSLSVKEVGQFKTLKYRQPGESVGDAFERAQAQGVIGKTANKAAVLAKYQKWDAATTDLASIKENEGMAEKMVPTSKADFVKKFVENIGGMEGIKYMMQNNRFAQVATTDEIAAKGMGRGTELATNPEAFAAFMADKIMNSKLTVDQYNNLGASTNDPMRALLMAWSRETGNLTSEQKELVSSGQAGIDQSAVVQNNQELAAATSAANTQIDAMAGAAMKAADALLRVKARNTADIDGGAVSSSNWGW